MTGRWGSDESGSSVSVVRVGAGFAAVVVGIIPGLPMCGLGLVYLMFAIGEPSSATIRLTAVGLALIVLGIACIVAGVRARGWIVRTSAG